MTKPDMKLIITGTVRVEVRWPNSGVQSTEYDGESFDRALEIALAEAEGAGLELSFRFPGAERWSVDVRP